MGKKSKKKLEKKEKIEKTKDQRLNEINELKKKINELGLGTGVNEIDDFFKILDEFVESGVHNQGKIPLNGFKRIINYILTNNSRIKCSLQLLYSETT